MDELRVMIQAKIKELSSQKELEDKRIFLFGYIRYVKCINNFLHIEGYKLNGIIDNDKNKQGSSYIDIPIIAPENIEWVQNDVVLIASIHEKDMREQIYDLSKDVKVVMLADVEQYMKKAKEKEKFWLEENYKLQVHKLYQGRMIYEQLKNGEPLMIVFSALGDMFACGLYFHEYEKKVKSQNIKIVAASKGVYKVADLFRIRNIVIISNQKMNMLVQYMIFDRAEEDIVFSDIRTLDIMAAYKKISFPKYWAKYFLKLDSNYRTCFPSIWNGKVQREELIEKGMIEGKTVILAPYANTCEELPFQFWEILTDELLKMGFSVLTNVVGKQQPVKNSTGIEIPLNQLGNYLEFAGYFISLRSGLCDVAGRSRCRQIIIFRDRIADTKHISEMEFFDLSCESISESPIQYLYHEDNYIQNIEEIINILKLT